MEPLVKNAADEDEVKEAGKRGKSARDKELNDLRFVLSSFEGRRFLWRLLGHCQVYRSIWEPSAKIHYYAGKQDVGHFIQAEIVEANQDAYFQMMIEAKKEK